MVNFKEKKSRKGKFEISGSWGGRQMKKPGKLTEKEIFDLSLGRGEEVGM